ncbi:MAG: imidazole glycerol phosphate synthase subunit HisF [Saprospiraceae bacterium]|nr:imidazole glycerol phosphate synthase subunit HisF [Saprospiraceae bacterium]
MLTKRIIPCLDIKNGRTVKGTNFLDLKDAGDPVELARRYSDEGADELVFLDISASIENRSVFYDLVEKIAEVISIPFTVGGGINDVEVAHQLLRRGADKVSINSSAVSRPELINDISSAFGSQCLIVAMDSKNINGEDVIFTHGGNKITNLRLAEWALEAQIRGAGEILFTSMDHDGTRSGFALNQLLKINNLLSIPVIASGGAGSVEHFKELFDFTDVGAGLAAGIFHYKDVEIQQLKEYLALSGIHVRL